MLSKVIVCCPVLDDGVLYCVVEGVLRCIADSMFLYVGDRRQCIVLLC